MIRSSSFPHTRSYTANFPFEIHVVDKLHAGTTDFSVLYVPVCPLIESNATCLARQRETLLVGHDGPDFLGGKGEAEHFRRPTEKCMRRYVGGEGLRAMGLVKMDVEVNGIGEGECDLGFD